MNDVISRKWLMECVEEGWIEFDTEKDTNKYIHLIRDTAPSVQPERLTDTEQRIFLAAMGKEEMVCKKVDDENPGGIILKDDCDVYFGGELNKYAQIDCPMNQRECDESCEYYSKLLLKCPLKVEGNGSDMRGK